MDTGEAGPEPLNNLRREALGCLVRFVLVYALLLAPWPGLRDTYASLYRTGVNRVVPLLGLDYDVRLIRAPNADARPVRHDTVVVVRDRGATQPPVIRAGDTRAPFLANAFLLALFLATPLPLVRRTRATLVGVLALNAFLVARAIAYLASEYAASFWSGLALGELLRTGLIGVVSAPWYIASILIWLFLACAEGYPTLQRQLARSADTAAP